VSGVTGLKMDILFTPVGGFSMSREHYLKNHNKKLVQEYIHLEIYLMMNFLKMMNLKIIIRRLGMNRIQRIQNFLQDYKSLNPYLKNLLKESKEDFQNELIKEYLIVSKHPYPDEYLKVS